MAKLGPRFTSEERIERVIGGDWDRLAQNDILFLPQEEARGAGET